MLLGSDLELKNEVEARKKTDRAAAYNITNKEY
jgi:hypothetical protein